MKGVIRLASAPINWGITTPGEEGNPEYLDKLKPLATRISVAEGEKKTVTLKLSGQ